MVANVSLVPVMFSFSSKDSPAPASEIVLSDVAFDCTLVDTAVSAGTRDVSCEMEAGAAKLSVLSKLPAEGRECPCTFW